MKLSLKEFFVHEAKSSSKHSSINIDVKSSAQINIKEAECLEEYEDPTSSKRGVGDSKWSSPGVEDGQEHDVSPGDAGDESGKKILHDSHRSSGHGKSSNLQDFFGGSSFPKSSEKVSEGDNDHISEGSSGGTYEEWLSTMMPVIMDMPQMENPNTQEQFSKYVRQEGHDAFETGVSAQDFANKFFGGVEERRVSEGGKGSGRKKGSKNKPKDDYGNTIQGSGTPSALPDEMPDEWLADEPTDQAVAPAGKEDGDVDWSQLDGDDFIDKLASSDKGPTVSAPVYTPPAAKSAPELDDKSPYQSFDPEKYDFDKNPASNSYKGPGENDQTWDEIRATSPKEAGEIERDFSPNELKDAKFQKKDDGRIFMTTSSGARHAYLGKKIGWVDMDDGESPAGEF